jgi:hypothetical protein
MSQPETLNTMFQGAFVPVDAANKVYALQVSGATAGSQGVPIETSIPVAARVTSVIDTNKVAAPGAGATIATVGPLTSGTYEVEITTFIGGTTVANTEVDNMELRIAGIAVERIINPVPGTTGATNTSKIKFKYDGASTVAVHANAAATASSIYTANIIATRIN